MRKTIEVTVSKSRFGKCVLTFLGPYEDCTNVYVTCDKDPGTTIRVWYFPSVKAWACEIHRPNGYVGYGTNLLSGIRFHTNKAAWDFAVKRTWS